MISFIMLGLALTAFFNGGLNGGWKPTPGDIAFFFISIAILFALWDIEGAIGRGIEMMINRFSAIFSDTFRGGEQ
jgi:hypothetical protein